MDYSCKACSKSSPNCMRSLTRHERSVHGDKKFVCDQCNKSFTRKDDLKRLQKRHQGIVTHTCTNCGKAFYRRDNLVEHQAQCQGNPLKRKCYEDNNSLAQKKEQGQIGVGEPDTQIGGREEPKKLLRKHLIATAKKKGIIYAGIMSEKQPHELDPTILCLPEVEDSRNNYRENHREEARETSRRWRLKNPEKSAAHLA